MISIVIPVYNAQAFLAEMLESILKQSYQDYEIILVNDGSKDNSSAICHQFAEEYGCIRVFDKENGGAASARNFGVQQALGEFVWFMDSDDALAEGALETAIALQKQYNADVVIGGMDFCALAEGTVKPRAMDTQTVVSAEDFSEQYRTLFVKNYISSLWNKLIRRSIIVDQKLEMIEQLHMYEDYVYSMDLLLSCQTIVCTPQIFYRYYLRTGGSLSHRYRPDAAGMFTILYERISGYKNRLGDSTEAQEELNRLIVYLAYECVKNEARCKERPLQKIRMLLNEPVFQRAMKIPCKGAMQYRIVRWLMKNKCVCLLWTYLSATGKNK